MKTTKTTEGTKTVKTRKPREARKPRKPENGETEETSSQLFAAFSSSFCFFLFLNFLVFSVFLVFSGFLMSMHLIVWPRRANFLLRLCEPALVSPPQQWSIYLPGYFWSPTKRPWSCTTFQQGTGWEEWFNRLHIPNSVFPPWRHLHFFPRVQEVPNIPSIPSHFGQPGNTHGSQLIWRVAAVVFWFRTSHLGNFTGIVTLLSLAAAESLEWFGRFCK